MPKKTRLIKLMPAIGLLLTPLSLVSASPAQANAQDYTTVKVWAGSQACMDVKRENPEVVQLWECNGQDQQLWQAVTLDQRFYGLNPYGLGSYVIVNKLKGQCLTEAFAPGDRLTMKPCDYTPSQIWWNVDDKNAFPIGWAALMQNQGGRGCMATHFGDTGNGTVLVAVQPGNQTGCPAEAMWWIHMLI